MAGQPTEEAVSVRSRLLRLGELRDSVFFLASYTYALGYLTWCLFALDRGLGLLPPLEGQYFLAGLSPGLLFLAAFGILRGIQVLDSEEKRARARKVADLLMGIFMLLNALAVAGVQWLGGSEALQAPAIVVGYLALAFFVRAGARGSGFIRWLFRIVVPVTALGAAYLYATRIFPLIPSALGGPKPTCVRLDLASEGLSIDLARELGFEPRTGSARAVTRSGPLWLHFEGSPFFLISVSRSAERVLRVRDGAVLSIAPDSTCAGV